MATLSKTSTNDLDGNLGAVEEDNSLIAIPSTSSTSSSDKNPIPVKAAGRTLSHSLLGVAIVDPLVRKGSFAQTEHTKTAIEKASLSMPPPSSKPANDRRLSTSMRPSRSFEDNAPSSPSPASSIKGGTETTSRQTLSTSPPVSTTAVDTTPVTTSSLPPIPGLPVTSPPALTPNDLPNYVDLVSAQSSQVSSTPPLQPTENPRRKDVMVDGVLAARSNRPSTRSLSNQRRFSASTTASTNSEKEASVEFVGKIGVCALDVKARSRPSRSILTRLQGKGEFEVIVFGDKAILDEDVENWPICDFLISFFSDGFPLDKAIAYVRLRNPFVVNDLSMQKVLWDRRLCLRILDQMGVPTPRRIEVNRDGGPKLESAELAQHLKRLSGVVLDGPATGTGGGAQVSSKIALVDDGDTLLVDGRSLKKPFVEKPVNGEDHNIMIYFPRNHEGGGGRRLFRKVGNKSSEYDPNLIVPRSITDEKGSYIYEQFLIVENAEDVKAYTVGPDYCHAETRKSPVVDGLVRRNLHGKELRYITNLNREEALMASKIAIGFGQRICGFDLLRAGSSSYVIDVNGFSFVKDNNDYYDKCARILRDMFTTEKLRRDSAVDDTELLSDGMHQRTLSTHVHRSSLRTILKSPSMSKLSNAIHHPHIPRHHGSRSPDVSSTTIPMTSPPSMDKKSNTISLPMDSVNLQPSTVITTANNMTTQSPPSGAAEKDAVVPMPNSKHSWKLKGMVTVIRHADRTPKQKFKFTFHSQIFVDLLKGHQEEVLLKGEAALASVESAVKVAIEQKAEDLEKLKNLRNVLAKKGNQPGTKVQIKPMFRKRKLEEMEAAAAGSPKTAPGGKPATPEHENPEITDSPTAERLTSFDGVRQTSRSDSISGVTFSRYAAAENDLILDKLQLVIKWGGEPTHSARYQAQDLGSNMRDDLKLMNKEALNDVRIFTSSERRVKTSAQIWAAAFLDRNELAEDDISVRKDLLDDSNAAKDVMDKVKKKLKLLLREGNSAPEQFAWPKSAPEPSIVMMTVVQLMKFHRRVMRNNFKKLNGNAAASLAAINSAGENKLLPTETLTASAIQARWCTGEDAELFKERWEKLFTEFCDSEKVDPSKISELYDSMKFDALHNKPFLEWVFMPSQSLLDEIAKEEQETSQEQEVVEPDPAGNGTPRHASVISTSSTSERSHAFAQFIGLRKKSVLNAPTLSPIKTPDDEASYFKLFAGSGRGKSKEDKRLGRLRQLYRGAKILFDYVGPQEYGISDSEKLEIGLLTSLPLLREIVQDLEELQSSGDAKSFVYFTKESHIYTLLNCIIEGGIQTKIPRASIPELDYLSQIGFELYEAKDNDTGQYTYSIRISISPGCHTFDPLDVSLDSKHAIGSAPKRSLTAHQDYNEVVETLKAKFDTVKLPKSFLAVNLSDKHDGEEVDKEGAEGAMVQEMNGDGVP